MSNLTIRSKILKTINKQKQNGLSIAFTNGCFDILHAGHVLYLLESKKLANLLIIGLNSDDSVKSLKGPSRPINTFENRKIVLMALECVDFVIKMNESTPEKLINDIIPDILVKGEDWKNKGAIGADIVKKNGGKVIYIPFEKQVSTTNIIAKISQQKESRS